MRARLAFTLVGRRAFRPRVLAAIKPRERSCLRWQLTVCNFGFTRLVAVSACTSGLDTAVETISPPYIEQRRPGTAPAPRRSVRDRGLWGPARCCEAICINPPSASGAEEYIGAATRKPKARHAIARAPGGRRHAIARAPGGKEARDCAEAARRIRPASSSACSSRGSSRARIPRCACRIPSCPWPARCRT